MKPIQTRYKGYYFRSRLEARWAVFFDALKIKWIYEPEGFTNEKTGECYLPDFYLPDTYLRHDNKGVYIEIKPLEYKGTDIPASKWFDKPLVLVKGLPNEQIWGNWDTEHDTAYECYYSIFEMEEETTYGERWDNLMKFWICNKCYCSKIEFSEGSYDYCPECKSLCDEIFLKNAATISSEKRFEHGENND